MRRNHLYTGILALFFVAVFLFAANKRSSFDSLFDREYPSKMRHGSSHGQLREQDPLFMYVDQHAFQLQRLSERKFGRYYRSYTTSNPNRTVMPGFIANPDMDLFASQTSETGAVVFEHTGSGCIQQIFMVGNGFSADKEMKSVKNLHEVLDLEFTLDGETIKYNFKHIMTDGAWPFIRPINKDVHSTMISGMGSMLPICFRRSGRVVFHGAKTYPDLVRRGRDCAMFEPCDKAVDTCEYNAPPCPFRLNVDIGFQLIAEYEIGVSFVEMLRNTTIREQHKNMVDETAEILRHPTVVGEEPQCTKFNCVTFNWNSGKKHVVLDVAHGGRVKLWQIAVDNQPRLDDFLVTMTFDGKETVSKVRLGNFFKATTPGVQQEFTSALNSFWKNTICPGFGSHIARSLFPLPFYKSARIEIEYFGNAQESEQQCHQFILDEAPPVVPEHGLFYAQERFYKNNLRHWNTVLDVEGQWGHMVEMFVRLDNYNDTEGAIVKVAHLGNIITGQKSCLEADVFGYVDGERSASITSTGFEDFFSMGHSFTAMLGRAVSFYGALYGQYVWTHRPSMHFFRNLFTDPIYFQNSITVMVESYPTDVLVKAKDLSYSDFLFEVRAKRPTVGLYASYYGGSKTSMNKIATFKLSEAILVCPSVNVNQTPKTVATEFIYNYVSTAAAEKVTYYPAAKGCSVRFTVSGLALRPGEEVVLRRDHYMEPDMWTEAVEVAVDGEDVGFFNSYLGSTRSDQARRETDLAFTVMNDIDEIKITYLTPIINDIEYRLYKIT